MQWCSDEEVLQAASTKKADVIQSFFFFFEQKDSLNKTPFHVRLYHGVCFVCVHVCVYVHERFVCGKPPHVQDCSYKCAHRIKTTETIVHIKVYRVLLLWTWKSKSLSSCVTDCYSFILCSWHMVYIISRYVCVHVFFSAFMTFLLQTHAPSRIRHFM